MLEKARVVLTTLNTWIVAAGAFLVILVDELTPLADLHPAAEWAVRIAGAAIVVLAAAGRIIARSTVVPDALQGLAPDVDLAASWTAWNGGRFTYTPPGLAQGGIVASGTVTTIGDSGAEVVEPPPPDTAA